MLWRVFEKIGPALIRIYRWMSDPPPPNLRGDRDIEYSGILANLPQGPGEALEFGCGNSILSLVAARRGFKVTAIDLTPVHWFYVNPNLTFVQKDIFDLNLPPSSLDLIINCSAIEHVGLGRYGDGLDLDGDLKTMKVLRRLLKPSGTMLLTIPIGRDATFKRRHRVYGSERLRRLLGEFVIEATEYWAKDGRNCWVLVDEQEALHRQAREWVYGLGCFVLKPAMGSQENW